MAIGRTGPLAWRPAAVGPNWRLTALSVIAACLILMVLVLGVRRLMGALSDPLAPVLLLTTVTLAALATMAIRWLWLLDRPDHPAIRWFPVVVLILLASVLSLPGTSSWAVAGVCAIVAGNVALQRGMRPVHLRPPTTHKNNGLSPEISQKLTRRSTSQGEDVVEGVCRAPLAAGQRIENYHVAFCPAFASSPRVTCRQVEGPAARVKVAQVLPQGMRIEAAAWKSAPEAATVVLEFIAQSGADV